MMPTDSAKSSTPREGFTLLEIMIVVAIIGLVLGIGIPSMVRSLRKEGMRAAVDSVTEACLQARTAAILSRQTVELVYTAQTREFRVMPMAQQPPTRTLADGSIEQIVLPPDSQPKPVAGINFSARIAEDIAIELLDVNFVEMKGAEAARVKFHPRSTSDEFSIVLRSVAGEWRKVSLDVLTALPEVESIR
jgi:prepilin-type N-terminal cleavage/methylation domain-containing protein